MFRMPEIGSFTVIGLIMPSLKFSRQAEAVQFKCPRYNVWHSAQLFDMTWTNCQTPSIIRNINLNRPVREALCLYLYASSMQSMATWMQWLNRSFHEITLYPTKWNCTHFAKIIGLLFKASAHTARIHSKKMHSFCRLRHTAHRPSMCVTLATLCAQNIIRIEFFTWTPVSHHINWRSIRQKCSVCPLVRSC